MKRGMRLAAIACAAVIAAAGLSGCSLGNKDSIDNQRVSVEGIKRIEVRCGENGGVTLGTGDQEAFIKMVNGFTLAEGEKSQSEVSQTAYCFEVEDRNGQIHSFQFFDQDMTVDREIHYQISEADSKALTEYWEDYGLADMLGAEPIPKEIRICKAYIDQNRPELQIDWSHYAVMEVDGNRYLHGGFIGIDDPASADWSRYRMVGVGNVLEGDHAYLIVDVEEGTVVAEPQG